MLKTLNYNKKNSFRILEKFLNKRKLTQKNQASQVSKIINNVKKNGDKAVLNYEIKFSKIKKKTNKIFFTNKEIVDLIIKERYKEFEFFNYSTNINDI